MTDARPAWYHEPKNHPRQTARRKRQNAALFATATDTTDIVDTRATDPKLFRFIDDEFHFTLDVAANADNAKCERYFTKEDDGLIQSWGGEVVWCNPPYSELRAWVAKATAETSATVVMLLPANRTEQPWWQEYIEPYRDGGGACRDAVPRRSREVRRLGFGRFCAVRVGASDISGGGR